MAIPPTGTNDVPPIDPKSFGMEDEDKSNTEVMKHRPWVTLSMGYIPEFHGPATLPDGSRVARLLHTSEQHFRVSLLFDTHLKAPFNIPLGPLNGMPFDFTIAPTASVQTSLDGSMAAGGGGDMLMTVSPLVRIYLKNEYQRIFAEASNNWIMEGGLRFGTGAYEGAFHAGFEFGFGGYIMTDGAWRDPNGYFHVGGNLSF